MQFAWKRNNLSQERGVRTLGDPACRWLVLCLWLLSGPGLADGIEPAEASSAAETDFTLPALDQPLQDSLQKLVEQQGLMRYVRDGRLALGLLDISDPDRPRFAALDPDRMMYAASLPKIAILLGAFVQIEAGNLMHDEALQADMVRMIRFSDNAAATRVLERVGRDALISILTSSRFRFYDADTGGGLWVGKGYAKDRAYRRDPLRNLSHGATVRQVIRFFDLLAREQLLGQPYDGQMKEILSAPAITHKFVAGLKSRPGARLYRKSGTWRDFHSDAALVETDEHLLVIAGLGRHPKAGAWLRRLAVPLHDLVVGR